MKKIINFLLCISLLSSCASGATTETASTSAIGTYYEATEITEMKNTVTIAPDEKQMENLILKPIKSDKTLDVLGCDIIKDFWTNEETEFLNKEHLHIAKELCYSDEEILSEIERYNEVNDMPLSITVKSAEDIRFDGGGTYDYDMDGEEESLLCLSYTPAWAMGGYAFVYVDEKNSCVLINECGGSAFASVMDFGEFIYVKVNYFAGASSYFVDIYSFEGGIQKKFDGSGQSCNFEYNNGFFEYYVKYAFGMFPFVCCTDGEFRQLGVEKITRDAFEKHVENGGKYIERLALEGKEVTEIYTCGYYIYWLLGKNFEIQIMFDENGTFIENETGTAISPDFINSNINITKETLYGKDLWNLNIVAKTDTEPALKPIASDKTTDVLGCTVVIPKKIENETDFPYPKQLESAREICFSDKDIRKRIDEYNSSETISENPHSLIEEPEDIEFSVAYIYDFDSDGENESIFYLNFAPNWLFNTGGCIYVDGNDAVILEKEINAWGEAEVLTFKDFKYMKLTSGVGVSSSWNTVYSFNKGMPEAISNIDWYKDGLFHSCYNPVLEFAPYICCTDGIFRQLGIEEITDSDFCSHVENGSRYLRRLKADGREINKIYTCGYYIYWLCGDDFEKSFFMTKEGAEPNNGRLSIKNHTPTDETIYGVDVWNLNIIT
ncbi:MAG: hypothetical protein IJ416_08875 [Ruminiclostridium sp.]|nr:hypothetical protein [Ruminiclostridium sp.]